jgi:hypothetical protein
MHLLDLDDDENVEDHEVSNSYYLMTLNPEVLKNSETRPQDLHAKVEPIVGLYYQYLDLADLIVKIDGTIYAHGYLNEHNMMQYPVVENDAHINIWNKSQEDKDSSYQNVFKTADTMKEWINKLRKFDDDMVDEWQAAIDNKTIDFDTDYFSGKAGRPLTIYMMWSNVGFKTVVESSMYENKSYEIVNEDLNMTANNLDILSKNNIKNVVGGHRPSGDDIDEHKQGTIKFLNCRMSFDNVNNRTIAGRVSKRLGWGRLEMHQDGRTTKVETNPNGTVEAAQPKQP